MMLTRLTARSPVETDHNRIATIDMTVCHKARTDTSLSIFNNKLDGLVRQWRAKSFGPSERNEAMVGVEGW